MEQHKDITQTRKAEEADLNNKINTMRYVRPFLNG